MGRYGGREFQGQSSPSRYWPQSKMASVSASVHAFARMPLCPCPYPVSPPESANHAPKSDRHRRRCSWPDLLARCRPAAAPSPRRPSMLTVDSIMRGPKLVGTPPSAVRWSKDSSKIYFTWQKAQRRAVGHVRRSTATAPGLRQLTPEEARDLDVAPRPGRFDRARRRALVRRGRRHRGRTTSATGARRLADAHVRGRDRVRAGRATTPRSRFMRDGNLYLMSLEGRATRRSRS